MANSTPAETRSKKFTEFLSLSNKTGIAAYVKSKLLRTKDGSQVEQAITSHINSCDEQTFEALLNIEINRREAHRTQHEQSWFHPTNSPTFSNNSTVYINLPHEFAPIPLAQNIATQEEVDANLQSPPKSSTPIQTQPDPLPPNNTSPIVASQTPPAPPLPPFNPLQDGFVKMPRARPIELPVFKGKEEDNISDYVRSFLRIKKANGWAEPFALDYLKCRLGGYAADWLQRYEADPNNLNKSLDEFLDDLKENVKLHSDSHVAERELLYERFQKRGESVRDFVRDMMRILDRIDPDMPERRKVTLIRNNMRADIISKISTPSTVGELVNRAEDHTLTKMVIQQRKKLADDPKSSKKFKSKKSKKKKNSKKSETESDSTTTSSSSSSEESSSSSSEDDGEIARKNKKRRNKDKKRINALEMKISAMQINHVPAPMVPPPQVAVTHTLAAPPLIPPQAPPPQAPQPPEQNAQYSGQGGRGGHSKNYRGRGGGRGGTYQGTDRPWCTFCEAHGHNVINCLKKKIALLEEKVQGNTASPANQHFAYPYAFPQPNFQYQHPNYQYHPTQNFTNSPHQPQAISMPPPQLPQIKNTPENQ